MAIQRMCWEQKFPNWLGLPCPSCATGQLKMNSDMMRHEKTAAYKNLEERFGSDPELYTATFSGQLTCQNPQCGDNVFVCGRIDMDDDNDLNGWPQYKTRYEPKYFEPSPPVFPISDKCPPDVSKQLKCAFSLIWSDHEACANRLRTVLEVILDQQKVQRKEKIKTGRRKGKFRILALHERIEKFAEKRPDAGRQLMALKWLGNAGSHGKFKELNRDYILDAFEHFEFAVDLIYVNHAGSLKDRAAKINKAKGSVVKRRPYSFSSSGWK